MAQVKFNQNVILSDNKLRKFGDVENLNDKLLKEAKPFIEAPTPADVTKNDGNKQEPQAPTPADVKPKGKGN